MICHYVFDSISLYFSNTQYQTLLPACSKFLRLGVSVVALVVPSSLSFPLGSGFQSSLRGLFMHHHQGRRGTLCPGPPEGSTERRTGAEIYLVRARTTACPWDLQCLSWFSG